MLLAKESWRQRWQITLAIPVVLTLIILEGASFTSSIKNDKDTVYSLSPDFQNLFIVRPTALNSKKMAYYQAYYLLFAKERETLPYQVASTSSVTWLTNDVAALVYQAPDESNHSYLGTYRGRGDNLYYSYVTSMTRGQWENNNYRLTNQIGKITVENLKTNERDSFDLKNEVQFGISGLVLTKDKVAKYALATSPKTKYQHSSDEITNPQDASLKLVQITDQSKLKVQNLKFTKTEEELEARFNN